MRAPSSEGPSALWTEDDWERVVPLIKADFEKPYQWVSEWKTIVLQSGGFEACRVYLENAQTIYDYIMKKIELLKLICEEMKREAEEGGHSPT